MDSCSGFDSGYLEQIQVSRRIFQGFMDRHPIGVQIGISQFLTQFSKAENYAEDSPAAFRVMATPHRSSGSYRAANGQPYSV